MKVAVIGTWHVHSREYAETVQKNPNAELACVWDDDQERGRKFAEEFEVPFVEDINTIWADPDIDSVQITTATCQHREVLISAASAGKNIFTEKVLAFTNEEAEEIAAAVRKSSGKFTISYPHKTWPTLKAAKELVESGKLGKITYARVRDAHNGSTADWLPPHFYDASQTGGGAMIDLGAHPMYTLNWFMGEPKSVVSMFTEVTHRGVEDNAVSLIEFADGAIGVSETGFVTNGMPYVLEMSGTQGSLMVHNDILEYSCEETENKLIQKNDLPEASPLPMNAWMDAVANGGKAPNGIDDAVALTKFMVGAYEAYRSGTKVNF